LHFQIYCDSLCFVGLAASLTPNQPKPPDPSGSAQESTAMSNVTLTFSRREIATLETALFNTIPLYVPGYPRAVFEEMLATIQDAALASDEAADRDAESLPGEDMDGDFDSAMASAGFGTDEDYGDYGCPGGED
jgi:hypothetical protein